MTQHNIEELRLLNQLLLGIFLAADFFCYLAFIRNEAPGFALLGAAVGLALIVWCWTGARYLLFNLTLISIAFVFTLVLYWDTMFISH